MDPRTMNPTDLEVVHQAAKKRKASTASAPKCSRSEVILAQPIVRGSSGPINVPRKEISALAKAMVLLRSATPMEPALRASASYSKRSLGGPKISIRMSNHGPNVLRPSKDAKEKAAQATRRADDAHLSKLKMEDENWLLKEEVKQLESELAKARLDAEAWVLAKKEARKEQIEATKVAVVEAFRSSTELCDIKMEFALASYLQGGEDLKEKIRKNFPYLNLGHLESDEDVVEEVEDRKVWMEDIFSPTHEDYMAKDVASAPPPTVIVLPD
ncbi:hypothetical protein COCNU_06G015870 [Cocos nucifera]|uniref:Uncharacterized protein n=1 Tax=Cocos nucifera TaxID=13894 RepID=A0A8K0ICF9_COCNU|nr:hypothetical protein COCNU_06G015870 [Cocos nucifera]